MVCRCIYWMPNGAYELPRDSNEEGIGVFEQNGRKFKQIGYCELAESQIPDDVAMFTWCPETNECNRVLQSRKTEKNNSYDDSYEDSYDDDLDNEEKNQADLDNHSNQLNPNNDEYWHSRGKEKP